MSFLMLAVITVQAKEKVTVVPGCLTGSTVFEDAEGNIIAIEFTCEGSCEVCYTIVTAGESAKGQQANAIIPTGKAGSLVKGLITDHQVVKGPRATKSVITLSKQ